MLKIEEEILVIILLLDGENFSEWVASSFAQPTPKTNRVNVLSDFRNLNKQLECKPYLMSKINKMLFKLESLQYSL